MIFLLLVEVVLIVFNYFEGDNNDYDFFYQALIDESIITPHATSCTCAACCDDDASMFQNELSPDNIRIKIPNDSLLIVVILVVVK